jgi:hypothetical protein
MEILHLTWNLIVLDYSRVEIAAAAKKQPVKLYVDTANRLQ